MALITIPSIRARSASFELVRGDVPLELMNGGVVVMQSTSAVWVLSFPLVTLDIDSTRLWQSALAQLAKLGNTFEIVPPSWVSGTGYSGPNALVNGASQLGLSLVCDGVTGSTAISLEGDYIEVGNELKILTADATSTGPGAVTFNFEPALRVSPANNDPVDVKTPKATMRLISPRASWFAKLPNFYDITIGAIESFGP